MPAWCMSSRQSKLHSGARTRFLGEFQQIVPTVRAEDGCLEYGAAVDVPTGLAAQLPLRDHVVVVVEKWRDLPALEAHLVAPHMTAYRARVEGPGHQDDAAGAGAG